MGRFRDESFHAIDCTGTNNQTHNSKEKICTSQSLAAAVACTDVTLHLTSRHVALGLWYVYCNKMSLGKKTYKKTHKRDKVKITLLHL